jgi:hypothetical protein
MTNTKLEEAILFITEELRKGTNEPLCKSMIIDKANINHIKKVLDYILKQHYILEYDKPKCIEVTAEGVIVHVKLKLPVYVIDFIVDKEEKNE